MEIVPVVIEARLFIDGYRGQACMMVDINQGHLFGVTLVGPDVTELL